MTSAATYRYRLPGGTVGVPTVRLYLHTLAGAAWWLTVPPLIIRLLARLGLRRTQHRAERFLAGAITRYLDIKLEVEGTESIDPDQQYLVTPLHESFADVLALLHLPLDMRFVARDELYSWRLIGPFLRDTGQIEVSPENGVQSYRRLVQQARALFAGGESLVLFPQGTILGIESDFRAGAFALARTLQQPLLPVALTGGHRVWEHPYTPRLRYGQPMSVRVLSPIPPSDYNQWSREALRLEVQRRLKAEALSGTMAPPRHFIPARDGYWDGYSYRIDPTFADLAALVEHHRDTQKNK